MLRYVFAPVHAPFARQLGLPRALAVPVAASAMPVASGPPAEGVAEGRSAPGSAVAITFDDGPHPDGTPAILEILARHGAVATFFVIGEQVARRPELLRRVAAEGHAVALHGHRHSLHLRRSAAELQDDFIRGTAVIEDAVGAAPIYHRPPYGIYSPASLRIARERGLQPLLWATWGKDWRKFTTPQRIAYRVLTKLKAGDVILLHDADFYSSKGSHERTAQALELVLTRLKSDRIATFLPG